VQKKKMLIQKKGKRKSQEKMNETSMELFILPSFGQDETFSNEGVLQ
jgi:hypothetical protein